MSTGSAVFGMAPAMPPERRFYRRVAPSQLVYISFGADNLGMLVNVSESGLMVSAPERLALNSVFRVELHLNGLAKTIKVHVRTVWTERLQKRSGIQLLDLSENDREQIRKWGRRQIVRDEDVRDEEAAEIVLPETVALPEAAETSFETQKSPVRETWEPQPVQEIQEAQPVHAEEAAGQEESGSFTTRPFVPALPASLSLASLDMDHLGNDLAPAGQNVLASRTKTASSKVVLIVWSASMAAICMATGWSYRHELGDRWSKYSAHSGGAVGSASQSAPEVASDAALTAPDAGATGKAASVPLASGRLPTEGTAAADAPKNLAANAADDERMSGNAGAERLEAANAKPNLTAPLTPYREPSHRVVEQTEPSDSMVADAGSEVAPKKDPVRDTLPVAPAEIRPTPKISAAVPENTRPTTSTSSAISADSQVAANVTTSAPTVTRPPASASVVAAVEPQTGANGSAPTAAVETRPSGNTSAQVSVQSRPTANATAPITSSPRVLSVDTYPVRSAITGSISPANSDHLRSVPASNGASFPSSAATAPAASPTANTAVSAHGSANYVDRGSPVIQMDVPAARVVELTSTSHTASFVLLSGEQVLKSNAMTIHVRRSVRVPGDHWLVWRAHKKVVLGGLTSRVDPQIPHAPASYGTITIQATIAEDGQVINVKPMNGNLAFLSTVTAAVNEWRYEPTYVDNRQVETQAEIEVDFHPVATLRASKR
jgi:hypothetical protein